ncbi:MAG: FecR family protein [Phocaeicola sp.]
MEINQLHKYFRGEANEREEAFIIKWIDESPENRAVLLKERMIFDAMLFTEKKEKVNNGKKKSFVLYSFLSVAALLALVFIIGLPELDKKRDVLSQTIRIPAGQRAQMELPDGTLVWLNSQTQLTYNADFGKKERRVYLDGEAYFEVAHNKEIPFYVATEAIEVAVTGTKFDVHAYKGTNSFVARLIEGSIDVYANSYATKPLASLEKGKYFSAKNGHYKVGELENKNDLAWMDGIYYFDDVPFEELLQRIGLYYNYKITVKSPKVLDGYRCTGKFKDLDGIEHILRVIQKDHHFTYQINKELNQIIIQ